jgi:hypothetical protein
MAALALVTAACTSNSSAPTTTPSTIAAGSPWVGAFTPVALPAPVNSLSALDCATATACWAVGSTVGNADAPNGAAVIASVDGGAKWATQVVPPTVGYLSGLSCSDRHHCTAVGQTSAGQAAIIATATAGSTWALQAAPAGILDITTVSCRAGDACVAVGSTIGGLVSLASASPTSAWVQQGALPAISGATDMSCSDATDCWVTGFSSVDVDHASGVVVLTTDGGATWTTVVTPTGIGYLSGVSCLTGSPEAAGALPTPTTTTVPTTTTAPAPGATTSPAPTTTTTPPTTTTTAPATTPPPTTPIVGVAGVRCTVVGTTSTTLSGSRTGQGVVLTSSNGGAVWTKQTITPSAASLRDVSCPSISACVAVGTAVATSDQAGLVVLTGAADHPWKRQADMSIPQPMLAVSCVSVSHCVAVGESISEYLSGA